MTALATGTNSIGEYMETDQARKPWRANARMIAMLVIVITSIASSLSYTAKADHDSNRQFEAKLSLYREQAQRISQAGQMKTLEIALAAQAALDASMVDAVPRSRALAEVSNAAPAGIRLVAISLDAEPRVSQSNPSPAELSQACAAGGIARFLYVEGVASGDTQVSQFVTRLSKSPWLHEVRQLSGDAASARSTGPRKFEVAATFEEQTAVK